MIWDTIDSIVLRSERWILEFSTDSAYAKNDKGQA